MPVDQKLVNCDMCVLAYQNYHQAVIWPLDPWYEVLARGGSNRRTLFMMAVHKLAKTLPGRDDSAAYAGPAALGALGESNPSLDPILTNYRQINPKLASFTGDGSVFLALKAPAYLTENLRYVKAVTRTSVEAGTAVHDLHNYGEGRDVMVAFEGGTGLVNQCEGAWSPMGFVFKRYQGAGDAWDAHIVFRGSRSGSAGRAAYQGMSGFSGATGNADWVTDMASNAVTLPVERNFVAPGAANGFANALRACFPAIVAALEAIATRGSPPANIYVAGHSLGAALASMFCCGVALNGLESSASSVGRILRTKATLADWPWDKVQGWFYALPPTGTQTFCNAYLAAIKQGQANAPYCDGDMVVECSNSIGTGDTGMGGKLGWVAGSGGYSAGVLDKLPKPTTAASGENPHELYLIRSAIVTKLGREGLPDAAVRNALPWGVYATFGKMLDGDASNFGKNAAPKISLVSRENLRLLLANYRFAHHFDMFLKMLAGIVKHKDSYRGVHWASTLDQLAANVKLAAELELSAVGGPHSKADIVDCVGTQVSILCAFTAARTEWIGDKAKAEKDGSVKLQAEETLGKDFDTRIGLGLLLRAVELNAGISLLDYEKLEVLRWCLEVKLS
jgi:hypothetical protein